MVATWRNLTTAPAYDTWEIIYQLRDTSDHIIQTVASSANLKSLIDDMVTLEDTVKITSPNLSAAHSICVLVRDPSGTLAPMNLASGRRLDDGAYEIGVKNQ